MRPHYSIVAHPTAEPITIAQASDHLRVDSTDDQAYIGELISVAREYYDTITQRASAPASYLLTAETWADLFNPSRRGSHGRDYYEAEQVGFNNYAIPIQRSPLVSVASIKYYAPGATELTTMASSEYRVVTSTTPGIVQLVNSPPAVADRVDAIQIAFNAGDNCAPPMSNHAIKMLVNNFYDQRVPVAFAAAHEIPFGLRTLIETQKIGGNF